MGGRAGQSTPCRQAEASTRGDEQAAPWGSAPTPPSYALTVLPCRGGAAGPPSSMGPRPVPSWGGQGGHSKYPGRTDPDPGSSGREVPRPPRLTLGPLSWGGGSEGREGNT